jgi:hypothetical protein
MILTESSATVFVSVTCPEVATNLEEGTVRQPGCERVYTVQAGPPTNGKSAYTLCRERCLGLKDTHAIIASMVGAALGAAGGAILGAALGGTLGAVLGTVIGTYSGYVLGVHLVWLFCTVKCFFQTL